MMPLARWMTFSMAKHPVWREIYQFLISVITAFSLTRILSRNMIYLERTFVPALIFPLVSLGYFTSTLTPVTVTAAFLLVFAIGSMINSHKREESPTSFLNAAVALGMMPLLYPPSVVFLFLLGVGFIIFRQNWRNILIALIGYAFPLLICSYVLWGLGDDFSSTLFRIIDLLGTSTHDSLLTLIQPWDYVLAGIYLILTVLAVSSFFHGQTQLRRRALQGFTLLVWTLITALGMLVFPSRDPDMLPMLAVPLSAILPGCFNRKSGWLPNLLYLLTIWSVLFYNLYHYLIFA